MAGWVRATCAIPLLVAAALSACATLPEPDLVQIHATGAAGEKPPLIVIPGLMGSRLVDRTAGKEIWPGSLLSLVIGRADRFDRLALPPGGGEDALEPRGLFFEALGEDYYDRLVETLTTAGGYDCVAADRATASSDCLRMAWDWRRDIVHAAAEIDTLIERLRRLRDDASLKVDLLGHSAGGLAMRYFIRFGGDDVLDGPIGGGSGYGAAKVNRALLLGVPNLGSIHGLQQMLRGHRIGNVFVEPELMATMPSLFQLLPHPDRGWMIDPKGDRLERDLYDAGIWRRYGWSIYAPGVRERVEEGALGRGAWTFSELEATFARSLRRAEAFHRALSVPVEDSPLRYVVFGSDCIMTPALCLLEVVNGEPEVRLHPDEVVNRLPGIDYERLMLEPGDGKVTRSSLLARDRLASEAAAPLPIGQLIFVCEPHAELSSNLTFRANLLNQLLYPWTPPTPVRVGGS